MTARIGIDTGGTFTDVVRLHRGGLVVHKLPSTPADPGRAVLDGLAAVRATPDEPVDLVHGTTVGLNAVLTGRLARTALLTNEGFEDLVEIGRQDRLDLYALEPTRPVVPVPRELRFGVACRRDASGKAVVKLTRDAVQRAVAAVQRSGARSVAIGLLHSAAHPGDELRLARAIERAVPGVTVTCSSALHPAHGEFERFSAAILNAAIGPLVSSYTNRIAAQLGNGTFRLLRSSMGILPADEAGRFPARAMFSGPAGGVLASARVAAAAGFAQAAAFDMGGTSTDVCLVGDAELVTDRGTIGGLPLPLPTVAVHTVGCGGGSIAHTDAGGALRVGPQSAAAVPGPACYGKGTEPTVTDAHLVLGHIGPETLLGGAFHVDVAAAVRAVERLARKLGIGVRAAAEGVLAVADVHMARALMVITAERAMDPRRVPLVAYGGAGGLHAASLAARLQMPLALVPNHPGAFSALGLCLAGDSIERSMALLRPCDNRSCREVLAHARRLGAEALEALGTRRGARTHAWVTLRFRGQGAGLALPLGKGTDLDARFRAEHLRAHGFAPEQAAVELVQLRVRCELPGPRLPAHPLPTGRAPKPAHRRPPVGGPRLAVHRRDALPRGARCEGPCAIEEFSGTTFVPRGFTAVVAAEGLRIATS